MLIDYGFKQVYLNYKQTKYAFVLPMYKYVSNWLWFEIFMQSCVNF